MSVDLLKLLVDINELCATRGLDHAGRLELFELAWLTTAGIVRNEALAVPGGFPAEQARQLSALSSMVTLVGTDTPDLEAERLFQERNYEGMTEHYRNQLKALGEQPDSDENGGAE